MSVYRPVSYRNPTKDDEVAPDVIPVVTDVLVSAALPALEEKSPEAASILEAIAAGTGVSQLPAPQSSEEERARREAERQARLEEEARLYEAAVKKAALVVAATSAAATAGVAHYKYQTENKQTAYYSVGVAAVAYLAVSYVPSIGDFFVNLFEGKESA